MALRVESCNIWTKEINDGTDAINRGNNHRITLAKENVARLSEDYNLKPFCQELVSSYILSKEREDYAEGVTRLLLENLLLDPPTLHRPHHPQTHKLSTPCQSLTK